MFVRLYVLYVQNIKDIYRKKYIESVQKIKIFLARRVKTQRTKRTNVQKSLFFNALTMYVFGNRQIQNVQTII